MYKFLSVVCGIWLLQSLSIANADGTPDGMLMNYYHLQSNSSCSVLNTTPTKTLPVTHVGSENSSLLMVDNIAAQNNNLTSVSVVITASKNAFYVDVTSTADGENQENNFTVSSSSEMSLSKSNQFKKIYLKSYDYSEANNNYSACFDVGFVYTAPVGNSTGYNVDVIDIGCWTWKKGGTLTHTDGKANIESWADKLNQQICSGSLSNAKLTTYVFLILPIIISVINK